LTDWLTAKNRLILPDSNISCLSGSKERLNKAIASVIKTLFYTRVIVVIVVLGMPLLTHASVFSFVSDMFAGHSKEAAASVVTSQNIALLQAALNPDPNPAKGGGDISVVGDVALLPETGPSGTWADIEEGRSDKISLYVVHEGDTLSEIAKMFGVSVNTIMWANNVTPKTVRPGDKLVVLPISGVQYTIQKGDTLKSIALKYKADSQEIIQFNGLKADTPLAIGSFIIIPDGEVAVPNVSTLTARLRGAGGPNYAGYYAKPLFSYARSQGLHGYNGIDMAAPVGTPIMASAAGEVIVSRNSGWNGGYGEYVVISHGNGTQTLYAHMSQNISYPGMSVFQGQVIGYVGSTGKSTGAHLHFEIRGAKNPF